MRRALVAALVVLALAGCDAPPPPRAIVADTWPATSDAIDSLAGAGRPEAALALADADLRAAIAAGAPAWRLAEPRAHAKSFRHETAFSPVSRARLAEAARALRDARAAVAAESLASAHERCESAWRIRHDVLGDADVRTAEATLALGEVQFALGDPGGADSLAAAARECFVHALGANHPRVADADDLLGRVAKNYSGSSRRTVARARAFYEEALRIRVAAYGPCSLPVAASWQDLGNLYRSMRRWDEALGMFETALELRRELAGPVDEDVASALGSIAYLHANAGHWERAEACARAAIAATPTGPGAPTGPLAVRLGLRGQMLRRMQRWGDAVAPLERAVALRESLWARMPHDEGSTVVSGLALHRDLAIALAATGHGARAFEELERGSSRSLAGRLLGGGSGDPSAATLLPRLQRVLAPDEAAITWVRTSPWAEPGDYPVWVCVVRASGPVRWLRLERHTPPVPHVGTIREALFGELIMAASWPRLVTDTVAVAGMARAMGTEWFAPLEPALAGVHRLVVCAPELFVSGSLGALQDANGRWLGERFAIGYMPSAGLFVRAREHAERGARTGPVLLVGDPTYGGADAARWPHLPGAARELASLARRFPTATVLAGRDASAARLRALAASGALGRFRLIHFAAHTAIDQYRVLDAAIVLAPDTAGGVASSRLLAREVADRWSLGADLVSLAACRSLRGLSSASDGDLGLQEAFLAAGARALLVTLWPVDDRATELLVETFYARLTDPLHPAGRAEALRDAQAALRAWRDPSGARPYAHPAYWAGFALVGDPG